MKKIAIYSRKSIETDKGDSINNQIKIVKSYFKDSECDFIEFQDEGFSGGNTNRPDFQRMMNLVKKKKINAIAVYRIDRIARNIVDFVNFYDELKKYNVELISVTEGFDFSTHMGKLVMMILATFADMERESIKQRVKDNMRELAKTGKFSGGCAPYGYKLKRVEEGGKECTYLELDESKKSIILEVFNLYLKEQSQHKVSKILKEKGIDISRSSIKDMLVNPVYVKSDYKVVDYFKNNNIDVFKEPNGCGFLSYNRRPRYDGKTVWNSDEMFYAVSTHEAVIDSTLFLEVQNLLKKRSQTPRPKESNYSYMSGKIYCKKCGSKMKPHGTTKDKYGKWKTYSFVCTGKIKDKTKCDCKNIKIDELHNKVLQNLDSISKNQKLFTSLLNVKENIPASTIKTIKNKLAKNDKLINNLVEKLMLLSNAASIPVTKKIEELTIENEKMKNKLLELESNIGQDIHPEEYFSLFKNLSTVLKSNIELDNKRRLFESLIGEVIWDDFLDDVFIELIN